MEQIKKYLKLVETWRHDIEREWGLDSELDLFDWGICIYLPSKAMKIDRDDAKVTFDIEGDIFFEAI